MNDPPRAPDLDPTLLAPLAPPGPSHSSPLGEAHATLAQHTLRVEEGPRTTAGAPPAHGFDPTPLWWSVLRSGERFEPRGLVRVSSAMTVHLAHDRDLDREVELHRQAASSDDSRGLAIARGLARLRHPALPLCYAAGVDAHGASVAVLSHPRGRPLAAWLLELAPGRDGAAMRGMLVAAVEQVARGLAAAAPRVGAHGAITPEAIVMDDQGRAMLTGWGDGPPPVGDPYRDPDSTAEPRPDADARALGRVLAAIAWGHPAAPNRRRAPGVGPEVALVAAKARDPRPGRGYADASALAQDLGRAIEGEAVLAGRSSWPRALARAARARPNRAIAVLALGLAALSAAGAFVLRGAHERSAVQAAWAASLSLADSQLEHLRTRAGQIALATQEERRDRDAWYVEWSAEVHRVHARKPKEPVPPALIPVEMAGSLLGHIDDQTLRNRIATTELASLGFRGLERLDSVPLPTARARREELCAVVAGVLLDRIEADLALATREEWGILSSRSIAGVAVTQPVHDALAAQASGTPAPELPELVDRMAESLRLLRQNRPADAWREAALLLGSLNHRIGRDHSHARRHALAIAALDSGAELEVGEIPAGVSAELLVVQSSTSSIRLSAPRPLRSGERLHLPVAEILLVLRRGDREVRHSVMLTRGEKFSWDPDWPSEHPPGDFVYVPAGRVRVHYQFYYHEARVEHGYWIGRHELSLEEFVPYLATLRNSPERFRAALPAHIGSQAYLLRALGIEVPSAWAREPVAPPRHPLSGMMMAQVALFMRWLDEQSGGVWHYRFPTTNEWELGVRGAAGRRFPWGDAWEAGRANTSDTVRPDGFQNTVVGTFPDGRSILGLHDGCGNVREIVGGEDGLWWRIGGCWGDNCHGHVSGRVGIDPVTETRGYPADGYRLACVRR